MLALCAFHLVCTMPYGINHGIMHSMLPPQDDNIWNVLIGICWWPFGCNFLFYVARHDQYRNAYQFYLQEKKTYFLSIINNKITKITIADKLEINDKS